MVPSFIYESESCLVVSDSLRSHGLYSPWNSLGQNTGVGSLSIPYPGDLSNPGIELGSPALQADSLPTELWGKSSFIHILLFYKIIFLWNFPGNAVFKFLLFPLTLLLSAQAPLFNIANRAILLPACWFTEYVWDPGFLALFLADNMKNVNFLLMEMKAFLGCLWKNEHSAQGGVHPDFWKGWLHPQMV